MMKSADFQKLLNLVPVPPAQFIDWPTIWSLTPDFVALDACPQDSIHHAEGDVGTHTRMVVTALVQMGEWQELSPSERSILFWAACLHDIGKPATTRHEDGGRITSRGHSRVGSLMARAFLRDVGAEFGWREAVCGLISLHQLPFWLLERADPERLAVAASFSCSTDLLCLHAKADALGRVCQDQANILANVALARSYFEELSCLNTPHPFANDESRIAYLERADRSLGYVAHEDFRCTAHVMSGLPGSGKDRWINNNLPDLPVVSLDRLRVQMGIKPTDNQGQVIQSAFEAARDHMRHGRDFVWNATNISRQTRGKVLRLLRDYNARMHVIYVEVSPDKLHQQNTDRKAIVPQGVIEALAQKLEPPTLAECHALTLHIG
jgi:putative nucleotidyltransferase with HDIG domain